MKELITALAKAQAGFLPAKKSGRNPHFKSEYSTYSDLLEATRESLTSQGFAISHSYSCDGGVATVTTVLWHESGDQLTAAVSAKIADNAAVQQVGATISYLKRYCLALLLAIASDDDDDDGNSVSQPPQAATQRAVRGERLLNLKKAYLRTFKTCDFKDETEISEEDYKRIINEIQSFRNSEFQGGNNEGE